jgi:23S rRNA (adenine2030-N6)-methyltransferase
LLHATGRRAADALKERARMNYRHAFHAGNFADVFKHVILTRILLYLMRKETPIRVIDTHAGEGLYDLSAAAAEKTAEWRNGVGRLIAGDAPSGVKTLLQPYLGIVTPLLAREPPLYPGSPALACRLLRRQDRMIFCDAQPAAVAALRAQPQFGRDPRIKIVEIDGFTALKAYVPPVERRGLVLIDPPFEQKTELAELLTGLASAARKWPTGVYMAWIPIKDRSAVGRFLGALVPAMRQAGIKKLLRLELQIDTPRSNGPLAANGLIILNPPQPLSIEAAAILPYLAKIMGKSHAAAPISLGSQVTEARQARGI